MLKRTSFYARRITLFPKILRSKFASTCRPSHTLISTMGGNHSCPTIKSNLPNDFSKLDNSVTTSGSEAEDPYLYTSGRWLHQDELQRQSRSLQFNFSRLCETAVKLCQGASEVVSYEKKEGGYNRVFILKLNTGQHVVARIPTSVAGPPRLTINSEVATIHYLQSKTSLPIPKILGWSDDPTNPVGTEYIIQEHVDGVQLHEQWPSMDSPQHMLCTKNLTLKIREMASLDFPAYGNIYFADAPIREGLKIPLESGFCIGPYCSPLFWNCGTGEAALYGKRSPNCGPWRNLAEYASGLVDTAFSRIPEQQSTSGDRLPFRGTIQEHIRLLHACRETMQILVADRRVQAAGTPTLIHADYNKRNIYVSPEDPTLITGLIDWQLTCVEPAFIYAHATPDFAALPDENPAEDEHTTQMSQSDDAKRLLKDISICHQTYDAVMKGMIPKIRPARLLDSVFFRLFLYCFTTWRDGVPAVRQELLDLKALWTEMELPGSCPYSPTEEELRDHSRQYEDFETTQKLKTWLKTSLQTTSDGWFPNEAWEAAKEAHSAAFAEWMETAREAEARGDDMTVEKAERLWPFDHR